MLAIHESLVGVLAAPLIPTQVDMSIVNRLRNHLFVLVVRVDPFVCVLVLVEVRIVRPCGVEGRWVVTTALQSDLAFARVRDLGLAVDA